MAEAMKDDVFISALTQGQDPGFGWTAVELRPLLSP